MSILFSFQNHEFLLLPEKAIWWADQKTIIIADLHLGKTSHFRKQGLPIPQKSSERDYLVLERLLQNFKPEKILILGDLFHSEYNNEWDIFGQFIKKYPFTTFELVIGNHDILSADRYFSIGLLNHGEELQYQNLVFSHKPIDKIQENFLNFSGHIHPGVRVEGLGRQSITMPCFYLDGRNFILPAFGNLTGLHILAKTKTSKIFAVSGSKIFVV